jgi:purine-nucleoside phosphorylase
LYRWWASHHVAGAKLCKEKHMTFHEDATAHTARARAIAGWIAEEFDRLHGRRPEPQVAIILGSGLNDSLEDTEILWHREYEKIPSYLTTTVPGHVGRFEIGRVQGMEVAVLRGRFHLYEGHAPGLLALPVRVSHALGVRRLIVTNAAGGLNPTYHQGDLMLIQDHIGLPTLGGLHPLIGANDDMLGPRFVPMGNAYDTELRELAQIAARGAGVPLQEGVYIMVSGPTYETPAELRALRLLGADAVGMSTVPEVIAARHAGMRVLGISAITNIATPEAAPSVNHAEVLHGAAHAATALGRVLHGVLIRLAMG